MTLTKINNRNYLRTKGNKLLPIYHEIFNDILVEIENLTAGIGANSVTPLEVNQLITDSISATLGGNGLEIDGLLLKDQGFTQYRKPTESVTTETLVLGNDSSNTLYTLDKASGTDITLGGYNGPNTVGSTFKFVSTVNITSNTTVIKPPTDGEFIGVLYYINTASGNAVTPIIASGDTITLNGGDTGGLIGTTITTEVIAQNKMLVSGVLVGSGSPGTVFSDTI